MTSTTELYLLATASLVTGTFIVKNTFQISITTII